jgi:hypothetical protein
MDESRVVPKGSHFILPSSHNGVSFNLTWKHRCTVEPVQYFFIDFGLSKWYHNGPENATALGVVGQLKDIPELSDTVPYNPFKLDICQFGRTILEVMKASEPDTITLISPYLSLARYIRPSISLFHWHNRWCFRTQMIALQ